MPHYEWALCFLQAQLWRHKSWDTEHVEVEFVGSLSHADSGARRRYVSPKRLTHHLAHPPTVTTHNDSEQLPPAQYRRKPRFPWLGESGGLKGDIGGRKQTRVAFPPSSPASNERQIERMGSLLAGVGGSSRGWWGGRRAVLGGP